MFMRIIRPSEEKEILINTNSIWKIEVTYGVKGDRANLYMTSLKQGSEDPEAIRVYKVFVASDTFLLVGNPDDPVTRVLEDIYKNAIKA